MEGFTKIIDNVYYLAAKTNIGLVVENDEAILIDSGNDKDAGRKIRMLLEKNKLKLVAILNTHSNADHIGANSYLMNYYKCNSYSKDREIAFSRYPDLESSLLYGGYPTKKMKNKFLMSKPCEMENIECFNNDIINYFSLDGHFLDMIGYKVNNVYFIGDSIFSKEVINKYHIFYIYDIKAFLETLDYLDTLAAGDSYFVASHVEITTDIKKITAINREKVYEIIEYLLCTLKEKKNFEELLKLCLDYYGLTLDLNQYLLVGSTIRNYLSYLVDSNKITIIFEKNIMYYQEMK